MKSSYDVFRSAEMAFLRALDQSGYRTEFRYDMDMWCAWMRPQVGDDINPTFNPELNTLGPHNAFWLAVQYDGPDAERRADTLDGLVACIACRLFVTRDYIDVIRSGRLWRDAGTSQPPVFGLPRGTPVIAGHIGHHGGCYVRHRHRGQGLPVALTRLIRTITGQMWSPTWHAGMIKQDPPPAKDLAKKYGYTYELPCIRGYSPVRLNVGGDAEINMTLIHRSAMVDQAQRDSALLQRNNGKNLRDVMAILTQRTEQPKVSLRQAVVDAHH